MPVETVGPYTRKGRRVSGYRRQRYSVLSALSGGEPRCSTGGCEAPLEELQIAHSTEDNFSGYDARSGGAAYSRWMKYVREHPENYKVLCATHHGQQDCRVIPSPAVHRRRSQFIPRAVVEYRYPNTSGLPRRAIRGL